ncbi:hypothetical protein CI109_106684 [Kwoniella shandongensis]|uniref:Uncharacterized protein n=1 Tax=Kwoniella shandongensis TaxID=1734106 RepID=A0A5M6BTB4_9TREE|nr:uncharacterized protein CI109_006422 [Kwoniella shandongensis]KAA5525252.1 hypothetical protein CI109_006422 [Kwoniella shandongensis]
MSSSPSSSDYKEEFGNTSASIQGGAEVNVIQNGSTEYIGEIGENGGAITYQDASGAPVEGHSPLGYEVSYFTVIFLTVNMMIGTGIFSTPASMLKNCGSVGLALFYWVIGYILTACGQSVYFELASYFPSRSGGEVVYLEQAYSRPKYFFPVTFAMQSVVLSFSSSNAIVMANYIFKMTDYKPSGMETKGVALGCWTLACLAIIVNTRFSLILSNTLGVIKLLTLVFISITGFVILGGHTKIANPTANFHNAFEGTDSTGAYELANALVNITFSYGGFNNAFNVINEVKNPIRTIKRTAPVALTIVAILYMTTNIAFFAAIPKKDILTSTQVTASLFFERLFGKKAAKGLTILPVLSAFGNILASMIGASRMVREVGRQGVLPFPEFWVSTRPFGTPLGPVAFKWAMTTIMILAPPAGDAFSFIVALQNYPDSVFVSLMTFGVFLIRRQRKRLGLGRSEFKAWDVAIILYLLSKIMLLVMPWVPPVGGIYAGSFSFFYATATLTGLGIIALCGIYYYFWIFALPKWGNYQIRQTVIELPGGAVSHKIVKVKNEDVAEWDASHDPSGRSFLTGTEGALASPDTGDRVNYNDEEKV